MLAILASVTLSACKASYEGPCALIPPAAFQQAVGIEPVDVEANIDPEYCKWIISGEGFDEESFVLLVFDTRLTSSMSAGSGEPVEGLGERAHRNSNSLVAVQGPWILELRWLYRPFSGDAEMEETATVALMRHAIGRLP